jgi:hypothetical protein
MQRRIAANTLLFFAVLLLPWWAFLMLVCALLFLVSYFYEAIVWSIIFDLLYNMNSFAPYDFMFIASTIAISLFILVEYFKTRTRLYK